MKKYSIVFIRFESTSRPSHWNLYQGMFIFFDAELGTYLKNIDIFEMS